MLQSPRLKYQTPNQSECGGSETRPTKQRQVDSEPESEDISDAVQKVVKQELISFRSEVANIMSKQLEEIRALRKEIEELRKSIA
jgi:hypothetical protein